MGATGSDLHRVLPRQSDLRAAGARTTCKHSSARVADQKWRIVGNEVEMASKNDNCLRFMDKR